MLLGTRELPLRLKSNEGDSMAELKLHDSLPKDGRTSFKPLGRGIEPEFDVEERSDFWGEEKVVPSSSNVTQLAG